MSALYGSLNGDGRAAQRTRMDNRETSAAARSYSGSVTVTLRRIDGNLTNDERKELRALEVVFAKGGGRGVETAERIDALRAKRDGGVEASIEVADGSEHGGRTLWRGPLAELVKTRALVIESKGCTCGGAYNERAEGATLCGYCAAGCVAVRS